MPDFPTVPTILYGAAYYHEYMPYERLDKDVQMMKAAGFNVVRLGESTWSLWEPEDGRFEYRVDGPRGRRHGQGRHQGHHGHAHVFDPRLDGEAESGNPGHASSTACRTPTACART
jgi:hypothetical protein